MVLVTGSDTVWHTLNKVNKHKQIQLRESGACTDHSDWGSELLFSCWMVLNAARLHDVMESWVSSGKFSLILFGLSAGGCVEVMWGLKAGRWLIGHFLSPFFLFPFAVCPKIRKKLWRHGSAAHRNHRNQSKISALTAVFWWNLVFSSTFNQSNLDRVCSRTLVLLYFWLFLWKHISQNLNKPVHEKSNVFACRVCAN